jgi:ribosomal protein S18 acetylase RimI-like enzyme
VENLEGNITVQMVDQNHKDDINLENEAFSLTGRFLPNYSNGKWSHEISYFERPSEMCFPAEKYNFDELVINGVIIGAYAGEKCVGLAILQHAWFKYMYLYDLKVSKAYRKFHIGSKLMEKAKEVAKLRNYNGIYTRAQDNNLGACLFYLKNGFVIGGIDTLVYKGTSQEGKIDILFYTE